MPDWSSQALRTLASAEEVHLATRRADGTLRSPRIIWVVTDGQRVFIRSTNGPGAAWYRAATATSVLRRAVAWFNQRGVTVERVLSDNGSAYRSFLWRDTCLELGVTPKRTRPYRPQTNGKIERFHRTLADGWAYARHYTTETERRAALPAWLHAYNHHRPHSACTNQPPFSRLTNVPGQYT